jgi:nitrogenase-associated protein
MTTISFYEKPGCGTNRKQKILLAEAGHEVLARNLLAEPWTAERLRGFFGDTPVEDWFNPNAPQVKSGEVDPRAFDADGALEAMAADPLLIRRPLIEALGQKCSGFDRALVQALLGPDKAPGETVACSRPDGPPCPTPDKAEAEVAT